ncbi:phosphatase 1 nuclear targeting subunit isoform X1 [Haematobia irritans]|uniref:phosphatase 1 nuclear targeting subunit isoform X1 n=2 Tax=Haematobia irritans TaxID=7368 RepID=UPI003F5022AF
MPRIVPIQLLKCLKVLLDDNGGILSAGEVKRLASLMTKYSKKLVSKCIYVQILKCTKTELLGEFMGAGGWSLVYTWLNDAIRAMNWPLVQEILELLLLCPVDVNRLKINSAPKLVKGLCKDGGNEGVRILAKRLVEQWLKVVTENPDATLPNSTTNMTPQATTIKCPPIAVVAPMVTPANATSTATPNATSNQTSAVVTQPQQNLKPSRIPTQQQEDLKSSTKTIDIDDEEEDEQDEPEEVAAEEEEQQEDDEEQDPLGGVQEPTLNSYSLTPAQKKASQSGLVYKIVVKNGNQFLAKVPKTAEDVAQSGPEQSSDKEEQDEEEEEEEEEGMETNANAVEENDPEEEENEDVTETVDSSKNVSAITADDNSSSSERHEKENDTSSGNEDDTKLKQKTDNSKKSDEKKSPTSEEKEKSSSTSSKEGKSSKDKERRTSSSSQSMEKDKEKEKDKDSSKSSSKSSSSSSHRSSSSSHKSSSSSSKTSSSSSKSKSSSSSSHRSSSDKYKSDKDRSSSSKDKDRSSSSSSSKHKSSSSKSSSSSSSSSSKDKYRDKEKSSSSSSSSSSKNKDKDRDSSSQSEKDRSNSSSSSAEKLAKISKKSKEEANNSDDSSSKPTSITIPSKKASMSIEIRKDAEKSKTVKTYKSQFRSHGLTEEAPPPPSRKGLKKPSSSTTPTTGSILPASLPSSLKRTSPPPRDSPSEKKPKIDMNSVPVANEKPGAIKLIPPKKIQTLVETNLFSDALSAATGPKKVVKRKRANSSATASGGAATGKEGPSPPQSPEVPKVAPLKFYQDTLDESKNEDSKSDKENEDQDQSSASADNAKSTEEVHSADKDNDDDDDDIPLKKVKEDIEQKVAQEKKMDLDANIVDITKDDETKDENSKANKDSTPNDDGSSDATSDVVDVKKPGPGCGPNGPPGVLMLHRRKGPKKKLTWRPQESLEQIRYFELDENERVNVTKTSFMDMKNLERFNERDAIVLARRGFNQEDNMEAQTTWKPLVEVDDVPPHPEGSQSKQRKIQAEREMTTLRALYFTQALIPDSPAEAEIEPIFSHDIPIIPLDDLTGNPDAVNDFTSMPWPEPRGSPKDGENTSMAGTGGLGSPVDIFGGGVKAAMPVSPMLNNGVNNGPYSGGNGGAGPFSPIMNPFNTNNQIPNGPTAINSMQNSPQGHWQRNPNGMAANGPMMNNPFGNSHGSPIMDMGGPQRSMGGGHMMNNGPPQNFNNQFGHGNNNNNPFNGPGPMNPFVGPSNNNFGVMGPGGPMVPPHMMNGMGPVGMMGNNGPPMMNGPNNRNNGNGNWRSNGGPNFQDNNGGGNGGGNWRPAGPGSNNRGGNGGGGNNNGVCKAFMRGHCRLGKSCKFIHPSKSKRI